MELTSQGCVVTLGARARRILDQAPSLMVKGQTSRGTFLQADHNLILFLTADRWRGPLTLNADALTQTPPIGAPGCIDGTRIVFAAGVCYDIAAGEGWHPAPFQHQRMDAGMAERSNALIAGMQRDGRELVAESAIDMSLEGVQRLLGRGQGLTPSGDDVVLGLMLMVNRALIHPHEAGALRDFSTRITQMAYERTTLLSANLIECAAAGEADERLIAAVDYLGAGIGSAEACADGLRSWGATSGGDALVGMAAACRLMLSRRDR